MVAIEIQNSLEQIDFRRAVKKLEVLSYNKRTDSELLDIVTKAIEKGEALKDEISLVKLYSLKITHLQHLKQNFPKITKLAEKILELSTQNRFSDGIALYYAHNWYIEKFKGNKEKARYAIAKSYEILQQSGFQDEFIYNICNYTYAIEIWLEDRNPESANILEKCSNYFYKENLYHGLAMSLGILIIIYQQTQNKKKSLKLIQKILSKREHTLEMPIEIQSIIHFFVGFNQELCFNLNEAETHLFESQAILKPIYRNSLYSGYYVTGLSYLTSTYALQGKLESALSQMEKVDKLIKEKIATSNLDSFSIEQIKHIFNLTKFYIHSRLQNFRLEDFHDLVQSILTNLNKYQSNAMFFSEFLLNAKLTKGQLEEIRNLNNPSTIRVEHIINFLIEKANNTDEKQIMKSISTLKRRPVEERMTFIEKAFADLIAAQEYYKIGRFAEISPLLRKYKNNLHKIEVLEMRVFMEAFIQVGAYKNGDPLGPALQYMAIKKCRLYGFSKLENNLLDYLNMQKKDALRSLA